MGTITSVPAQGHSADDPVDKYWEQETDCAGFTVSSDCQYRYEEMELVTFTPDVCVNGELNGCENLVAYARVLRREARIEEAMLQFATTIFTCFVLAVAFIVFSHDTEVIVIRPIKKVVEIIQKLADDPLKKPVAPENEEDSGM